MGKIISIPDIERMTAAQVGELCGGTSWNAVGRWPSKGCPRNKDRTFNGPATLAWFLEREKERAVEKALKRSGPRVMEAGKTGGGDVEGLTQEEWKTRQVRAGALQREIALDERRGKLVEAKSVEGRMIELASIFKQNLVGLPSKMAGLVYGHEVPEVKVLLEEAVREILENITQ